jgi:NAD(P)-dependent dehydrogenase (short-subunit alcohol dehydrogenase family)
MLVSGSVALVTGANRGLGRSLVLALLGAGASKVHAAARDERTLAPLVVQYPGRVLPLRLDITDPAQIAAAARQAGDTTLLINNAGVLDHVTAMEVDRASFDRNFETNFFGTLGMTRTFASVVAANGGGSIVTVLSFLSFVSAPVFSSYNASKAASWSMMMSLRPTLQAMGVALVNVFPTTIATDMVAALDKPKDSPDCVAQAILAGIGRGDEDIYPMAAADMLAAWRADQKAVERRFAAIT